MHDDAASMENAQPIRCFIYRSRKKDGLYLFVSAEDDFSRVPATVMSYFGKPERAMELELTPDRRLARADAAEVIAKLNENGFYIQLPPPDPFL